MSNSKPIQTLSFAEIIQGRDASVRVTQDRMIYAVDLVMVMTGKDRDHAGQAIRGISEEKFSSLKISERNTGGCGNSRTKLVSFEHALELIMVLPGDEAKRTRVQFADILKRYMGGDQTLIAEVNANAASNSPIAQMARGGIAATSEDEAILLGFKRRREELELVKMDEETKRMKQTRILEACAELERISDPNRNKLDERTRLMMHDAMQNSILSFMNTPPSHQGQIANGPSPNTPISISGVAVTLGYKPSSADVQRIGMDLRKRYFKKHNKSPAKHEQLCDGRMTMVNSYTEQDRALVSEALDAYFHVSESDRSR